MLRLFKKVRTQGGVTRPSGWVPGERGPSEGESGHTDENPTLPRERATHPP
jgi:hypothetical protein